jgi:predicted 3-demethylubiquinone-9 3-methyltransferase (glyoxalase superfamily)
VHRAPSDYPSGKAGNVLTVEFTLMGRPFVGSTAARISSSTRQSRSKMPVETQVEIERLTNALSAVPEAEQCGWVSAPSSR